MRVRVRVRVRVRALPRLDLTPLLTCHTTRPPGLLFPSECPLLLRQHRQLAPHKGVGEAGALVVGCQVLGDFEDKFM